MDKRTEKAPVRIPDKPVIPFLGKVSITGLQRGSGITVEGNIPHDLELFKDHFPGFPVLPGILSLEIIKRSVEIYETCVDPEYSGNSHITEVRAVKFLSFLKPGNSWQSVLELKSGNSSSWQGRLQNGEGKTVCSARLTLDA